MKDLVTNEHPIILYTTETINEYKNLMKLKEELGCPLDVISKLRKANYIYRDDGLTFGFVGINFNDEDKLILYNDDECNIFTSDLKLSDYGKKFWLKKIKVSKNGCHFKIKFLTERFTYLRYCKHK